MIVTRPRAQARPLVKRLTELGHEVILCPLIEIERTGPEAVDVSGYDWVVVTSPNGAEQLAARRRGRLHRVAAVGPGTAEVLAAHGIAPDIVPVVSTQEGLVAELRGQTPGRVLFVGAEGARRYLVDHLDADFVPLYRTVPVRPPALPDGDLVVLASASAARAFAGLGAPIPAVSIGPQATAAALKGGVRVVAEARSHDLDGLVAAVENAARRPVP